ncbi:MAG: right-handed parallel beta-helix repeat-containing protein [Kiritimatiellae bacterium]|nr:right-handed parallel beta-helix repeat-containing protein [Kiritimatiellia bacterium]
MQATELKEPSLVLYVSKSGDDRWSGQRPVPSADRQDGPVATPGRALLLARKMRPKRVQVEIQDGVYELDNPLVFTPADSGQRWSAAPGTRPLLSGGRRLNGWKIGTHDGRVAWTLELPDVRAGKWNFTQLWVNGRRRSRPRLPKSGYYRFRGLDGQPNTGGAWYKGPDRAEYDERHKGFRHLEDISLVAYQLWFETTLRIEKIDVARRLMHFRTRALSSLQDESGQLARYALFNVAEALTEPGEWYLDRSAGILTYLPFPDETPDSTVAIAPRLPELIRFQGSRTAATANVVVENLALAHNEWQRSPDHVGVPQAAFDVPGAVVFDRAERCVLYGCELAHCAGYGIEMLAGSHGNVVAACTLRDLGAGAIKIGHEMHGGSEVAGHVFTPDKRWLRPMAATVADCRLYDGGHVYPSAVGVWIGNAGFNRIQRNHIHHFTYTGISVGWAWGFQASRAVDNRIESNHIHHINEDGLLSDNGGIYTLGVQPGTILQGNHVHDVGCYRYGGRGLYLDEGSSGILVRNNCVHDVAGAGFYIHLGRFVTVRNNIFANMRATMLHPGRKELSCGSVFERNLTWFDTGNLEPNAHWTPAVCRTRDNLVWNASAGGVRWRLGSLKKEQAAGCWTNSIESDPLFADPRNGDFTLRADSPALALGFKPFDWRKAGVRAGRSLPAAWSDYRLPPAPQKALAVARLERLSFADDGDAGLFRVKAIVANPSARTVVGVYRIATGLPPGQSRISPSDRLKVRLKPGQETTRELTVRLPAHCGSVWLQMRGDERTLFSAALSLRVAPRIVIPRLPAFASAGAMGELEAGLRIDLSHSGHRLATARVALSGDRLAVAARIVDPRIHYNACAFYGSSFDVYVAPEPPIANVCPPEQVTVVPPHPGIPAELRRGGYAVPFPRTDLSVQRTADGWRFQLLLPSMTALKIDPSRQPFRFDVLVNLLSPIAGENQLHFAAYGTEEDFTDARLLARAAVVSPVLGKTHR